jgi:hypothetical protein
MPKLCKHQPHKVISDIKSPKWSTDEILIGTHKVTDNIEHYIIQFEDESPRNKYNWFYMAGKDIRRSKTQPNGRGEVYVVSMKKRQPFVADKKCNCMQAEFINEY